MEEAIHTTIAGSDSIEHCGSIFDVSFHPTDSCILATASDDETGAIWHVGNEDVASPCGGLRPIARLRKHSDPVMRISWHPRGEIIATGSADCTAALWRLAGSEEGPDCGIKDVTRYPDATGLLAGHPEEVYACEWHDSIDDWLVTASGEALYLWSAERQMMLGETGPIPRPQGNGQVPERWQPGYPFGCAQQPRGRIYAAACSDGCVRLWQLGSERSWGAMGAVAAHGGMGVGCFFADETTVVSAGTDGSVTTLDVRNTSQPVTTSHAGAPVAGITRGSGCCEGHAVLACRDGTVRVWEPKQGSLSVILSASGRKMLSAAISPCGRRVVAGCQAEERVGYCPSPVELASELKGVSALPPVTHKETGTETMDTQTMDTHGHGHRHNHGHGHGHSHGHGHGHCGSCGGKPVHGARSSLPEGVGGGRGEGLAGRAGDVGGEDDGHSGHDCEEDSVWIRNRNLWGPLILGRLG